MTAISTATSTIAVMTITQTGGGPANGWVGRVSTSLSPETVAFAEPGGPTILIVGSTFTYTPGQNSKVAYTKVVYVSTIRPFSTLLVHQQRC